MQSQTQPIADHSQIPADDYLVVGGPEPDRAGVGTRIVHGLQLLMIVLMAALSFAIFWIVGLILNVL